MTRSDPLYCRYVAFTIIYDVSGGKGTDGEEYIYDVLDWRSDPGRCARRTLGT